MGKSALITNITKTEVGDWFLEYQSVEPVKSIQLAITPDRSRASRWRLTDNQFLLIQINGRDIITRRDNKAFSQVSLKLTPTYIHLHKYYAPFSPYSNGGMLIHSARFFACANICSDYENSWYLTLTVPDSDKVYLHGKSFTGKTSWWDSNDGTNFYVGKQLGKKEKGYISVIDQGLPLFIKNSLDDFFPKMMSMLEHDYGKLISTPMLFASFGKTSQSNYGRQGGVLPHQVFMHWYGNIPSLDKNDRFEVTWFFAHEAAHLYQGQISALSGEENAWLQEGHAEYLAMLLVQQLMPDSESLTARKLNQASTQCKQSLEEARLSQAAKTSNYQLFYQCGLFIFDFIAKHTQPGYQLSDIWRDFISSSKGANFNAKQSFMELIKNRLVEERYEELAPLVN